MYGISNSICFDVFRRVLHFLFIGAFFIVAISCGAKYIGTAENGVPIPNEFVRPETYLTNFPLNKLEKSISQTPMMATQGTSHLFIVNPFRKGGLRNLFSTHPPITQRVERLQKMADNI